MNFIIGGIATNMSLHQTVLLNKDFRAGNLHTRLLDEILAEQTLLHESQGKEALNEELK